MSDVNAGSSFGDGNFAEFISRERTGFVPSASRFSISRKSFSASSTR